MPTLVIWPLLVKGIFPIGMQQRPRWTGGLAIPKLPVLPWDNANSPPSGDYGVDTPAIVAETLPTNFALAALGVQPLRLANYLHPQRPRPYHEQSRTPSAVRVNPPAVRFQISGQTKGSTGAALGSCSVNLFRTSDDAKIESVTSNADGYYYFKYAFQGTTYYAVAYKAGSPDVAGTTANTLVGS